MGAWARWCPVEEPFPADPSPDLSAVTESALENSLEGVMAAEGSTETQLLQQRETPEEGLLEKKMFTIFLYKINRLPLLSAAEIANIGKQQLPKRGGKINPPAPSRCAALDPEPTHHPAATAAQGWCQHGVHAAELANAT